MRLENLNMAGIYIHIPFCRQACHYCDFHFSTSLKSKDDFIKALLSEMDLRKHYAGINTAVDTIYFGGGTPSLLDHADLDEIFTGLYKNFSVSPDAEITLEANPDDLTPQKIKELSGSPVNRLSIGIQSFDDAELKWMNRAHNSQMAIESVRNAMTAGFGNISADLIYGSPLLTDNQWTKNLETVLSLGVPHLSCYSLTIEERTPLAAMISKGNTEMPDDGKSATQLGILMDFCEANGFEQYEISNFCRNGMYSRHNSNYWKGIPYTGFGPSAHSYDGKSRQWNVSNNMAYINTLKNGNIPATAEVLTPENAYNEYIMTSLRTGWGVSIDEISAKHGNKFALYFSHMAERYINSGNIEKNGNAYKLTRMGKFFADRIASDLFYDDGRHLPANAILL